MLNYEHIPQTEGFKMSTNRFKETLFFVYRGGIYEKTPAVPTHRIQLATGIFLFCYLMNTRYKYIKHEF